jgi:hypothetical protein
VHLLLGSPDDPLCQSVRDALEARSHPTQVVENPLVHPWRLAWRLSAAESASHLGWRDEPPITEDQISSVFVTGAGWIDPDGWQRDDLMYVQAETHAALLAWLWSLPCPVINRYPSALWYCPRVSLLSWRKLLRRCGLALPETLVTNVEAEARSFGRRLASQGVAGAVYAPLTSNAHYLVSSEKDWSGLAAMQERAPVCLADPHGRAQSVCVVGEHLVWEGEASRERAALEPAVRRFANALGLAFVELAFAPTRTGLCVISVETHPNLHGFGDIARGRIVDAIVELLAMHDDVAQSSSRRRSA